MAVLVIVENVLLLIASGQNMIQCAFKFNSPCSTHNVISTAIIVTVNFLFTIQDVTPFPSDWR
ncbi:MAG: hypothetical protein OER74_19815, partial [Desulfobacteraceae bacterium]|nr:hypothetical protein [Desulfobacteraceae bacterium]